MYDAVGNFSVQFMRRDRGQRTRVAVDNNVGTLDGYDAYFGRYELGRDGTVRQELLGALKPGDLGKVVTRRCRVDDAELVIELEATNDGQSVTRTLRWERAG
jgi:hypothetical protein